MPSQEPTAADSKMTVHPTFVKVSAGCTVKVGRASTTAVRYATVLVAIPRPLLAVKLYAPRFTHVRLVNSKVSVLASGIRFVLSKYHR